MTSTGTPSTVRDSTPSVRRGSVKRTSRTGAPSPLGAQLVLPDDNPHLPRELVNKLIIRQGRDEADHRLGGAFRCLCETLMGSSGASGS
jgi:hypothetical protein